MSFPVAAEAGPRPPQPGLPPPAPVATSPTPVRVAPALPAVSAETLGSFESFVAWVLRITDEGHFALALTCANGGEGVTTTAIGGAIALAENTLRNVLLVDANLRKPAVRARFGIEDEQGLSDLIISRGRGETMNGDGRPDTGVGLRIWRAQVPNLWVMPAGTPVRQPAALMTSDPARSVLAALRAHFGYVVIDCPPTLTSVEASCLCRDADEVALVVRAGVTTKEDVIRAQERLEGATLAGVVLSGA